MAFRTAPQRRPSRMHRTSASCITLVVTAAVLALSLSSSFALSSPVAPFLPYPAPCTLPSVLYLLSYVNRSLDDQLLLTSLQGALAQVGLNATHSSDVVLTYRVTHWGLSGADDDSDQLMFDYYRERFPSVKFDDSSLVNASLASIVQTFLPQIRGFILTPSFVKPVMGAADAIRTAISLAGIHRGAIVATPAHLRLMSDLHLPMLADTTSLLNDTEWVLSFAPFNQSSSAVQWPFHRRFFSSQAADLAATFLSDWTIMAGVVMINHVTTGQLILDHVQKPQEELGVWLGWTPDGEYEDYWVHAVGRAGGMVWAGDTLANFAVHAFFPAVKDLQNPTRMNPDTLPDNRHRHTVAFLWTDGDSLCADQHGLASAERFRNPHRTRAPMTFGLDPSLAHLAPNILSWYYDMAADGVGEGHNSSLIAFSPAYTYPDDLAEELRWQWGALAAEAMQAADMGVNYFIGWNYSIEYAEPLLSQFNIEGVVYFEYLNYYRLLNNRNGSVLWSHGKPFIAIRESLWLNHTTGPYIADLLNAQSRDSTSPEGYSVIAVSAWFNTADSVLSVIAQLDEDILVVKVDEMVQLMQNHISPQYRRSEEEQIEETENSHPPAPVLPF